MQDILTIEHLSKTFSVDNQPLEVLKDIDLTIKQGEFVVIVGHSGCGKSTLLKIMAGLEHQDNDGVILYNGSPITGPSPERGMIFQEHRLMPWMTLEKNVSLGLIHESKVRKKEIADKYLKMVHLYEFRNAYPSQISGGMSQRAAIARALTNKPQMLLLDEPFGALDAMTKIDMQNEIVAIRNQENTTMIMVTHDIEEAVFLANRIIVFSNRPGHILDDIEIQLPSHRDRTSADFAWYKKKVYDYFFIEEDLEKPEFFI